MIFLNRIAVLIAGFTAFSSIPQGVNGSPYVISDDRVRSLDITPALGRGYSIMTNSFQSTCLSIGGTTVPSYNYDYSYSYHSSDTTTENSVEKSASGTFAYWWVTGEFSAKSTSTEKVQTKTHMIVATMRMERYYTSVREDLSSLSDDALELLGRQDYVGFFKACGPNYVRSIRRAQEVTAILNFKETDTEKAKTFSLKVSGNRRNYGSGNFNYNNDSSSNSNSENKDMQITIKAFGLGLSHEGSDTLVATTMEEFQEVMKYAFRVMTQGKDSHQNGMVYGMEVVPWVDSTMFQIGANIDEEIIEIPLGRSVIPRAVKIDNLTDSSNFANDDDTRITFTCIDEGYVIDKFGYCCEVTSLYDVSIGDYDPALPEERICRPIRALDNTIIKNNLAANGEFVARLDRAVRFKLDHMSTLERCISAARSFPERYDPYILKAQDTVMYDGQFDPEFTVFDLKTAIDPFNDFGMVKHLAKELDEFVEMFYAPCLAALFGSNIGTSTSTDPSYFMAYPWHTHSECLHLSCFGNGMRWNRDSTTGGCTPGLISGSTATAYSTAATGKCAYDNNKAGATEECKHSSTDMNDFHNKATACWTEAVPAGGIDYFMGQYCMPQLTGEKVDPVIEMSQRDKKINHCNSEATIDPTLYSDPFHIKNKSGLTVLNSGWCADGNEYVIWTGKSFFHNPKRKLEYNYKTKSYVNRNFSTRECGGGATYMKALTAPTSCTNEGTITMQAWAEDQAVDDENDQTDIKNLQRFVLREETGFIESLACSGKGFYVEDNATFERGKKLQLKTLPAASATTYDDGFVFTLETR